MLDLSLKNVAIGTAVVGGIAVAVYYAYKWITTENKEEKFGRFNDEIIQIVRDVIRRKARAIIDPKTVLLTSYEVSLVTSSGEKKSHEHNMDYSCKTDAPTGANMDTGDGCNRLLNCTAQSSEDMLSIKAESTEHVNGGEPKAEANLQNKAVTTNNEIVQSGKTTNDEIVQSCKNTNGEALNGCGTDEPLAVKDEPEVDKRAVEPAQAEDKPDILTTLPRGEWGSNMRNGSKAH